MATAAPTMSLETLHASPEYKVLTDAQKRYVDAFVESQDAPRSLEAAYGSDSTPQYRSMLLRKIQTSPRVLAALDHFYSRSEREKFLRDLALDVTRAKGVGRAELRRLQAHILGFDATDVELGTPTAERFRVGDICVQNGRSYRVSSIDAETGRPLTADEVE